MGAGVGRRRPTDVFHFRRQEPARPCPDRVAGRDGHEPAVRELRQPVRQPGRETELFPRRPDQQAAWRGPFRTDQRVRGRGRLLGRTAMAGSLKLPVALTIAGSDSGGGAGIQADLKTFAMLGVHGTSAITAVTAQNTLGVSEILELPTSLIREQIAVVVEDIGVQAAKTGMLSSAAIIATVAEAVTRYEIAKLVVDPVMVAKGGARLLRDDAVNALRERLIPLAAVVTPNLPEAQVLLGREIQSLEERRQAARDLVAMGARVAVVKAGHAEADVIDVYFDGSRLVELSGVRIQTPNTHGSGCVF